MEAVIPRLGVLAVGRDTFDVPYAEQVLASAWESLRSLDVELCGKQTILFDADQIVPALEPLKQQSVDLISGGVLDLGPFISERVPFPHVERAFQRAASPDTYRVVVTFNG